MSRNESLKVRSTEIICGLQEEDGGFLATAKDDAYPFVYPRDGVFMTMALNMHGHIDRSKKFYDFLRGVRRPNGEVYQRYNLGLPYVTRREEADVTPLVIQGVYDTYICSGDRGFLERMWGMVAEGAEFVLSRVYGGSGLVHTTCSIHENQSLEEGFEIWSNSAAVKGLLDASRISTILGRTDTADIWRQRARQLWENVAGRLYNHETGLFTKTIRDDGTRIDAPDVAQLSPFYFGLCRDRTLLRRTLRHVRGSLWNDGVGGVNRFRDFEIVKDWHWYTGGTNASWPLFTVWLARFHRRLGESDLADECMSFVQRATTGSMEIPEKVAPVSGYRKWRSNETEYNERIVRGIAKAERSSISIPDYIPWACPLGWSHAEFLLLDRKDESEDENTLALSKDEPDL
jgi:GH15 family glucan-1,4-alpha-glucosidase